MVWVHGGVHDMWDEMMLPFVLDAVARGYAVIAPDYRGSTGYGRDFYNAIDYGGKELDDVIGAKAALATVANIDTNRVGILGWSHGAYIAAMILFRRPAVFRSGGAIAPVTNLIFRLAYKGPGYAQWFATQAAFHGLPHENPVEYVNRSPVYWVDSLRVPMLAQFATNDHDVDFVEGELLATALREKSLGLPK